MTVDLVDIENLIADALARADIRFRHDSRIAVLNKVTRYSHADAAPSPYGLYLEFEDGSHIEISIFEKTK